MGDILVVGAGFSGATIANTLAENGHTVHVIDKRNHIAGNAYDFTNEIGIRVHQYGPHIFHTNNSSIFNYLQRFGDWVEYHHRVKAILSDGRLVTLPPNKETAKIIGKENIIDVLYRPYTKKMWDLEIEEIDPKIIQRVAIREDENELYFPNDQFQFMPKDGYTEIIRNMLSHKRITVDLNYEFKKIETINYKHTFNSMPIDEYYDFKFGRLPYRSIKFHSTNIPLPKIQDYPTINLTNNGKFTRVTEWKNYPQHGENEYETTITWEEPCCYTQNNGERYYPVKDINGINRERYKKYRAEPNQKMTFIGRCGQYVYLDMHQAISNSLNIAQKYREKL
jgi:UDP-galactopyranose mutase